MTRVSPAWLKSSGSILQVVGRWELSRLTCTNPTLLDQGCPLLWDRGPFWFRTVVAKDLERADVDSSLDHDRHWWSDRGSGGHVFTLSGDGDGDSDGDGDGDILSLSGPHLLDKPQNEKHSTLIESGWHVLNQTQSVFNNRKIQKYWLYVNTSLHSCSGLHTQNLDSFDN